MTLAAVWIEDRLDSSTMCFASDSRTTPGPIDGIGKVTLFGRSDMIGVWAGDFTYAALILNKLQGYFSTSENMSSRQIDVDDAFRRSVTPLRKQLNDATSGTLIHRNLAAQAPSQTYVVVGGYSIKCSEFIRLKISLQSEKPKWAISVKAMERNDLILIGDAAERKLARKRSKRSLRLRKEQAQFGWHMEPLHALSEICAGNRSGSVGGDLQFAKVYRHGESRVFGTSVPGAPASLSVRGTRVDAKASKQLRLRGLAIERSNWSDEDCYFH